MPNPDTPVVAAQRAAPTLLPLGALCLANAPITRPKPLLLLAYLAHEGPIDRERRARLLFVSSRDPRDALTTTLRRLHGLVAPASASDARLHTPVTTDALAFQHARGRRPRQEPLRAPLPRHAVGPARACATGSASTGAPSWWWGTSGDR